MTLDDTGRIMTPFDEVWMCLWQELGMKRFESGYL